MLDILTKIECIIKIISDHLKYYFVHYNRIMILFQTKDFAKWEDLENINFQERR